MSTDQSRFYFVLFGMLRKASPGIDRHALHAELALPKSHTEWTHAHFDTFKAHALAVTRAELPGDESAKRGRHALDTLLAALGEGEDYAETIVFRMNKGGKLGGKGVTLGSLTGAQIRGVVIALDRECKRRFPTREALIAEIHGQAAGAQLDEAALQGRLCAVLRLAAVPQLADLGIDRLRIALATVRRMAGTAAPAAPAAEMDADDVPF